jgi:hypothetical protein
MDINDFEDFDEIFLLLAYRRRQQRQRIHTGQSGDEYIRELLNSAHPERVYQVLRMQLDTFYALRDWSVVNTDLIGSSITHNQRIRGGGREVSIEEKLAIFIYIISRGASNRDASERFSRGRYSITRYVYKLLLLYSYTKILL